MGTLADVMVPKVGSTETPPPAAKTRFGSWAAARSQGDEQSPKTLSTTQRGSLHENETMNQPPRQEQAQAQLHQQQERGMALHRAPSESSRNIGEQRLRSSVSVQQLHWASSGESPYAKALPKGSPRKGGMRNHKASAAGAAASPPVTIKGTVSLPRL